MRKEDDVFVKPCEVITAAICTDLLVELGDRKK